MAKDEKIYGAADASQGVPVDATNPDARVAVWLPAETVKRIAAMSSLGAHAYINSHLTPDIMRGCEEALGLPEPSHPYAPGWPSPLLVRGWISTASVSSKDVRLGIAHIYPRFELDRLPTPGDEVLVTVVPATRESGDERNATSDAGPKVNKTNTTDTQKDG